jgi:hypothetical protein
MNRRLRHHASLLEAEVFIVLTNRSLIRSTFQLQAGKREYSPRLLELHVALPPAPRRTLHDQAPFPDDLFRMISACTVISRMRPIQLRPLAKIEAT